MVMLLETFSYIYSGGVGSREKGKRRFLFISSARFSMLVNSSPCNFFPSSRALFAILLSSFFVGSVNKAPLVVSHLLFANDILIFCDKDSNSIFQLCSTLIWIEAASGLRINFKKA